MSKKNTSGGQVVLLIIGAIIVLAAAIAFNAWLIMVLWNFLVPALFGGPAIGFWHGLALLVIVSMIGGAFRGYAPQRIK